ncbi:MAG: PD40 domain-containing protein [Bacteroidetes bacterium]|nr:PD40 domain-containing protein [Bacteroidota bacterium]
MNFILCNMKMYRISPRVWKLFFLLFIPVILPAQFYNGSQTDFGQNRVQYQDFKWNYYKFPKYEVYYNTGGSELAIYVARAAKNHIADIEKYFDYTLEDRIQFIVYNKQEDFKQSNVGLNSDDGSNVGGVTRIVGRKVFLYYEGDHVRLEEQIRAGIAEILINEMMYGGNVRDMVKNSTLLNLPEWYTKGLINYIAKGWDSDIDNRVRDGIMSGRYRKFNHLTGVDAQYAGQSIWYYIAEKYSPAVIPNILYMTKVSRNVESSFLFVIGVNMKVLTLEWEDYYAKRYSLNDTTRVLPANIPLLKKPKSTRVYSMAKLSPDGKYITYVTNEMGQVKLWLEDLTTGKRKRLFKQGQKLDRINDYSYPLVTWHPTGELLSFIYESKGETWLCIYTLETKEKTIKPIYNFIKIIDINYSPDGKSFVMSAVQNGQTDIFVYNIGSGSAVAITKDIYDDLYPRFIDNGKSIIFSSNRVSDTLGVVSTDVKLVTSYDLFVYDYLSHSNVLRRITNTPGINEMQAQPWDNEHFSYISDQNGIYNRYVGYFDSVIAYVDTSAHYRYLANSIPVTNLKYNILSQDVVPSANKLSEIIFHDGKYFIYIDSLRDFNELAASKLKNTAHRDRMIELAQIEAEIDSTEKLKEEAPKIPTGKQMQSVKQDPGMKTTQNDSGKININNYQFEGHGQPKNNVQQQVVQQYNPDTTTQKDSVPQKPIDEFLLPIARNYKVQFSTEYVVSQLDNSFLNAGYQRFTGGESPVYLNPGFTGLFKIGMSDLLEDHKIVGGVRLSSNLKSNEYVLYWEDRTRRWDKSVMLHRQSFLNVSNSGSLSKIYTEEVRWGIKYPFNEVLSLRGNFGYRNDQRVYLADSYVNLLRGNTYSNSANGKIELVFDNTIKRGLNLYNGMRFKVFVETFQGLDSIFGAKDASNRWFKNDLYVAGFDFRYYQKVHREIIWANRICGATSFGHEKLIYYMGGVDNWLMPKFDQSVRVSTDMNYTYQTLATPMRGFWQNGRNGNSFAMVNSELRIPVFRYLFNRPLRSDFINNFQIVGFGDIGTAWTGKSPYDPANSLNTTVISAQGNPIMVILKNHTDPIIGGYGFGVRSRIWGYFVRADWAWGVENRTVLPRILYLSFSLDF